MPTQAEIDLARLAARNRADWTLETLIGVAEAGLQVSVTVVVDGVLISGDLASSVAWGERLDAAVEEGVEAAESRLRESQEGGEVPEGPAILLRAFRENSYAEAERRNFEDAKSLQSEIEAAVGESPWAAADLPDELARRYIYHEVEQAVLTLDRATVRSPRGFLEHVGTIRVLTSHVGAWWMGKAVEADSDEARKV